ncbi:MAG: D-aminoacyl-tRNA deacylase [Clostridia bacterium]|nr:D-aminoacyl-tRNA deacylase [Clostridia bacterium]
MRAVVQRVHKAHITINHEIERETGAGLVVFLGVMEGDTKEQAEYLAKKISGLRLFTDENDKINLSLQDIGGDIMVVSNFTLSADCRKGNRPSFINAAKGETANELYEYFVKLVRESGCAKNVETGEFGADMDVDVFNNGPITLMLDTNVIAK